jgi:hypothetical protein
LPTRYVRRARNKDNENDKDSFQYFSLGSQQYNSNKESDPAKASNEVNIFMIPAG